MGFQEAVRAYYLQYVDFEGRSPRSAYWWPVLFRTIINTIFVVGIFAVSISSGLFDKTSDPQGPAIAAVIGLGVFLIFFSLANIIPSIAVTARRFHDLGYTGWLYLAFIFAGMIIPAIPGLALLIWFIMPGNRCDNRFGPDPLVKVEDTFL
jgi:uncharacterized membrane protein YhaH (DUF805 family)